ncbi:DUF2922 domain-containing protein [uncultured Acetobacterium sp.]|uniref:DUF2922 domain-containing protein n=1 Tax=uncultured Acetobacterium sp. TaxID=217139 RepID=UPI002428FBB0|nr:DUF2922 domain-containing protein [uncultured Acetobacterium sp.]MBU4541377.1 DUF2922 domain-containing protein [Bacillota bacterium]MDP2843200.1 DUF2922 domain-containing protein [Acetobacterium sp.]
MAEIKARMVFARADGKNATITVSDADPAVTETQMNAAMDSILTRNVFAPDNSDLVKKVSGKLISTTTNDFEMTV